MDKETENKKPEFNLEGLSVPESGKKLYAVGCYSPEDWEYIHEILTRDGTLEDNIPKESVECSDLKQHSATRAVYLLSDEEAEELKNHPRVQFVNINFESYPATFKAPPEELICDRKYRYDAPTKQYRNWYDSSQLPSSNTINAKEVNRGGYQILRMSQKADPFYTGASSGSSQILNDRVPYLGDGTDVDVIVADEGFWIGHYEFQNNTGNGPKNYVGGNKLKAGFSASATTGTCDLLDLVLDAPYYIDPAWFEASPSTRLTLRWDGTTVPIGSVARAWWGDASQRSAQFSSIGTITVTEYYTREICNGSNSARPTNSTVHGTQCAANAFGRTQGWAFNANKWVINAFGYYGTEVEQYFDIQKLFHLYKPINSTYGTQDPTISSNSWGYRSTSHRTNAYYFYRQGSSGGTGVSYTASTLPGFMNYVGLYGDSNRMKGEMIENSLTTAGKEMIDAGVIFVNAAGNSNQKQVSQDHPDFHNYWSTNQTGSLVSSTHFEFGVECYNTTNRRGFPQQLGKYNDPGTGALTYPVINIGALDDSYDAAGLERKVNYSDMGNEIDVYAPADGTLSAHAGSSGYVRPDNVSAPIADTGFTAIANTSQRISGTSAFAANPNTAKRITTDLTSGTVTTITNNLLGPASLTASTVPSVGNNDDGYWNLVLPFNISFNGVSYTDIYIGTNTYITFSGGSTNYDSLNLFNPAYPKIMISSADNSCQRIYYGTEGSAPNRTYRVRYEGTASPSGTLGAPNMIYEIIFYENAPSQIDVQIGSNARYGSSWPTSYDTKFSGTSSACPAATGLIATKLQYNRNWTWKDVRNWLRNNVGTANTSQFYTGVESTTANASTWADVNSLEGGSPRVLWDALTGPNGNVGPEGLVGISSSTNANLATGTGLKISGVNIKYTS